MRISFSTIVAIIGLAATAPAAAQAPATPQRQLSDLLRQDATLREQIGRIQLDALVARVDQTLGHKPRLDTRPDKASALRRDLDLYAF